MNIFKRLQKLESENKTLKDSNKELKQNNKQLREKIRDMESGNNETLKRARRLVNECEQIKDKYIEIIKEARTARDGYNEARNECLRLKSMFK